MNLSVPALVGFVVMTAFTRGRSLARSSQSTPTQHEIILEAVTAAEALRLFCDSDHHVDLLITVLTLAKGSGTQVALQLRLTVPILPAVILASCCGPTYWTDQESAALRKLGTASVKILEKPFFPSILLRNVHELIGAPNE